MPVNKADEIHLLHVCVPMTCERVREGQLKAIAEAGNTELEKRAAESRDN